MSSNSEDDDERVGYKRPPKHSRIQKGEVRNPYGRRGKNPPRKDKAQTDRDIIGMLDNETVEYDGRKITKREAELRVLHSKAIRGDIRAMKELEALREKTADASNRGAGVLLLPSPVPLHEWEASAAIQQAQSREKDYWKDTSKDNPAESTDPEDKSDDKAA